MRVNVTASAQRLDVKLRAAGGRPASSGAPLAAHPIMPVQVARRRANSRRGSRLGRRKKRGRAANFNGELARACYFCSIQELAGAAQCKNSHSGLLNSVDHPMCLIDDLSIFWKPDFLNDPSRK